MKPTPIRTPLHVKAARTLEDALDTARDLATNRGARDIVTREVKKRAARRWNDGRHALKGWLAKRRAQR